MLHARAHGPTCAFLADVSACTVTRPICSLTRALKAVAIEMPLLCPNLLHASATFFAKVLFAPAARVTSTVTYTRLPSFGRGGLGGRGGKGAKTWGGGGDGGVGGLGGGDGAGGEGLPAERGVQVTTTIYMLYMLCCAEGLSP